MSLIEFQNIPFISFYIIYNEFYCKATDLNYLEDRPFKAGGPWESWFQEKGPRWWKGTTRKLFWENKKAVELGTDP